MFLVMSGTDLVLAAGHPACDDPADVLNPAQGRHGVATRPPSIGEPIDPADADRELEPAGLSRLLLFGTAETRHQIASRVLSSGNEDVISLLADTVRSSEPWLLRARCLEVLGMVAGAGDRKTSESILTALGA